MGYQSNKVGIYSITHISSGRRYIGSSINIAMRFYQHKHLLRKGTHHSKYLQRCWNKYGEADFLFSILDYCEKEELITCEQQWIDSLKPEFNLTQFATRKGAKGKPCSLERKQRMSRIMKGRPRSAEYCANISKGKRGKPMTTISSRNTSGHVGVSYAVRNHKWRAQLNGKYVGLYKTLEEAVQAREKAVQELAMVEKGEREEVKLQAVQGVRQKVYDSGPSEVLFSQVSVA